MRLVDLAALKAIELLADVEVQQVPALTMQREALLVHLYNLIWLLTSGGMRGLDSPEPNKARAIAHRLSLITELILVTPTSERFNSQAAAAVSVSRAQAQSVALLLSYAHLSEVMPDVHRGNFVVAGSEKRSLRHPVTGKERDLMIVRLDYPDPEWGSLEGLDIALSTLSIPRSTVAPEASPHRLRLALAALQNGDMRPVAALSARFGDHYLGAVSESGILGDAGLLSALGIDTQTFRRFRAALMGLAEWGVQSAGLVQKEMRLSGSTEDRLNTLFSLTAMSVNADWLQNVLSTASGTSSTIIRGVLDVFTLGGFSRSIPSTANAGDGFFPPLTRLGSEVMFSPRIMLNSLTDRNVAFALNRLDQDRFAREVSEHLEPKLVSDMSATLRADPLVQVVTGIHWSSGGRSGEIDAAVVRSGRSGVLHLQAKGAIPATGSKSTRHVETRVQEGIRQSRSFAELDRAERDRILGGALGRSVVGEPHEGAVLVRSNFGTARIWREAGDVSLLTLPLLRAVVKRQMRDDGGITPRLIPEAARSELAELRRRVSPGIHREFADLYWVGLDLPVIDLDEGELLRMVAMWA
jgi:hypothetical protein